MFFQPGLDRRFVFKRGGAENEPLGSGLLLTCRFDQSQGHTFVDRGDRGNAGVDGGVV